MADTKTLAGLRQRIDDLDKQMQTLLNQRAEAAMEVAQVKLSENADAVFYRPEREAQILRQIQSRNTGPLDNETLSRLFREIMSACLALERPLRVAYLGPEGTFTQAAALKHFGHAVHTAPMANITDVFQEIESHAVDYGVAPVENSTEGVVNHTLDMFLASNLQICGEVSLRIHHNLLGKSFTNDTFDDIQTVYSHQQSFAQCRAWLDRHLPHVDRVTVSSNAEAARLAAAHPDTAAIAGVLAAKLYDLNKLATNIEDEPGNTTRFLVVGRQTTPASGQDKTSLLLSTRNEAGGLYRLLQPLAEHNISMTRIESRPSRRGNWDYVFFVDILGHQDDADVATALKALQKQAGMYKVLGSYPQAVL